MGQYGAVIGGVVGAVVGFFAGGNVYAGWMIGSAIGGAYSASQQVIPGPKIGDVSQQTSQEGVPRPIVFGRSHPIAGNIICDGGPRIVKRRESQGKGGPKVESESAYRTYAVGVCEGPITAFLQVWKNNQLVYDVENPAMADENADFLRYARFFLGGYDQMPSPDLEAIKGAGNISAHRGTAYMVLRDEDVTDQRGMWSQWTFRVGRFNTQPAGLWWALPLPDALDPDLRFVQRGSDLVEWGPQELRGPPNVRLTDSVYSNTVHLATDGRLILFGSGTSIEVYTGYTQDVLTAPEIVQITSRVLNIRSIKTYGDMMVAVTDTEYYYVSNTSYGPWVEYLAPDSLEMRTIERLESGRWICWCQLGSARGFYYTDNDLPKSWLYAEMPNEITNTNINDGSQITVLGDVAFVVGTNQRLYKTEGGSVWVKVSTGEVDSIGTQTYSDGEVAIMVDTNSTSIIRISNGGDTVESIEIGASSVSISKGNGYWVLSGSSGTNVNKFFRSPTGEEGTWVEMPTPYEVSTSSRWRIMFADPPFSYKDGYYPLADIIAEVCDRADLGSEKIDSSDIADYQVRGFTITNQYPAYGALQTLSQAFFFDPSNISGRLKFVGRGSDAIASLVEDDMVDSDDQSLEETRRDTLSIPRILHLNYYDVAGGLNTDKQISERPEEPRANGEQAIQTPVVLSADEAATIVAINHGAMAEMQKGELNFSLPDSFLRLTESDPVIVQWDGKSVRGVIAKVETDDGEQRYKVYRDRQSLYSLEVEGIPAAPVSPTPSRIAGPTLLQLIDIPILRDADDRLGFYIAVSGVRPAWQGAFVEASFDGGETYEDGQRITSPSIIGSLSQPLGDHPQAFPDYVNTATVFVQSDGGVLSDSTLTGMMNRRNLAVIGDEIVNFAAVDEIEEGTWEVSNFLRGRKGTETQEHEAGTRFVLLDGAIFVPADLILLNRTITFRATTFGRPTDEATIVNFTFTGKSQRERAPAYLQSYRDGANIVASWQGVGRLGGGVNVAMGSYFSTYRVSATDGSTTSTQDVSTMSANIDASIFTGPVTVSVSQVNSMTGQGPSIEVVVK